MEWIDGLTRDQWIEEWLRTHPDASFADAVFEFEDMLQYCIHNDEEGC